MKNRYRITETSEGHFILESLPNEILEIIANKLSYDLWIRRDQSIGKLADAKEKFKKTIDKIESYPKYHKI